MHPRFNKLNFIFLAMTFLLPPLALKAQATTPKWTGFHAGVIGGTASGNYTLHTDDMGIDENESSTLGGSRIGLQGGVDFNFKGLVVGAVADWSWTNVKFKEDLNATGLGTSAIENVDNTLKQMTTIRARAGRSYGRVLPYVHGGLLLTDTELKVTAGSSGLPTTSAVFENGVHPGFVVGAGVEYMLTPHYSLTTEYGFNRVNNIDVSAAAGGGTGTLGTEHEHFNAITVGFNYHF
jgi:opacity protein-like surface antigen